MNKRRVNSNIISTKTLAIGAILTALVIVLQGVGVITAFFGPFATATAIIPIVIGAAMCGPLVSTWLGLIFGLVVLLTGQANLFLTFSSVGTVLTVIAKGAGCGLAAGLVYKFLEKHNKLAAVIAAAAICPIVNTGVFLAGSAIFFLESASEIAVQAEINASGMELFWIMATGNFILEITSSIILSPVFVRVLNLSLNKK